MSNYNLEKVDYLSDGTKIKALQYIPKKEGKHPAIVMAHGFGLTKEAYIDKYAEKFAENGFVVILFDYRNVGESDGLPRQEINPFKQIDDYKNSITYACSLDCVDENRIGIWGTSYSGGHVIVTAATDKRVKCVVSQVPTISGFQSSLRRMNAEQTKSFWESVKEDRLRYLNNENPQTKKLVKETEDDTPIYPMQDAEEYYLGALKLSPFFKNEVTLRSNEYSRMYEPGIFVSQISPTPILYVVAMQDSVTPTDLILKAYENTLQPKAIETISGGHFSPYIQQFDVSSNKALEWFINWLMVVG